MNKADLEEKQERRMRYGFLALLLLVLGGIHFMDPAFIQQFINCPKVEIWAVLLPI